MTRATRAIVTAVTAGLIISACDITSLRSPNPDSPAMLTPGDSFTDTTLGGFTVHFAGRSFSGSATTFSYTVSGPPVNMHFRLGYPITDCAQSPSSWYPSNGTTSNNDCCINPGVEWHPSTGGGPYTFSYSFVGDIPLATVPMSVKVNDEVHVASIAGPSVPLFNIDGTVYQDAGRDGTLDPGETGITNVTVRLYRNGALTATTTSSAVGEYVFSGVVCGTYVVEVDTTTLTGTQTAYFTATTPVTRTVSVGPNSPDNDFGFATNSGKLKSDLQAGTLPTTGFTAGFWKKQVAAAKRNGNAAYTRAQVLAFIAQIEGYLLVDPYTFPADQNGKLNRALDIFSRPTPTTRERLIRELLALEFNYAAGKGIDPSTQFVLMGWGESLVGPIGTGSPRNGPRSPEPDSMPDELQDALEVFEFIDKSTGGGGVGS